MNPEVCAAGWRRMAKRAYIREVRGELLCVRSVVVQRKVMWRLRHEYQINEAGIRRAENDLAYKDPHLRFMQDESLMLSRAYRYAVPGS